MLFSLIVLSSSVLIASAIIITYPETILNLVTINNAKDESILANLNPIDKSYLLLSFLQLPLMIMLVFSHIDRFNIYGYIFIGLYAISHFLSEDYQKKQNLIRLRAIPKLFMAIDIIRSCYLQLSIA